MDAQKFGTFIAQCRKEKHMTQTELAKKLMITDKAVSRWERGKGFPDISLLLPLASALDLSLTELMCSEKKIRSSALSPKRCCSGCADGKCGGNESPYKKPEPKYFLACRHYHACHRSLH